MLPRLWRSYPASASGHVHFRCSSEIALDSVDFPTQRARSDPLVDKTGAIADLLAYMHKRRHVFFARPRKFGKSTTLSIAGELLAAGALPPNVKPWLGYKAVDTHALFGGLEVHRRLLREDATLGDLLRRPHFVIKLSLGDAQSGTELRQAIKDGIADTAAEAFGEALSVKVQQRATPSGALGALVGAVPSAVPIALLVDEYDGAIIQDVSSGRWEAAATGMEALRSLLMATKNLTFGPRIQRCLVTGVARLARTSLLSGAANFKDLTNHPLLSRVLGFSEEEICATFPVELQRLAHGLGMDRQGAIKHLAHWYNGYCFDGASMCFNPFPVLSSLSEGCISGQELEGASSTNWLGLTPGDLVHSLVEELTLGAEVKPAGAAFIDVADLARRSVQAVPLLLQTGLLSQVPGAPLQCIPPNEYARASLQRMLVGAMEGDKGAARFTLAMSSLSTALALRSHTAFAEAVKSILLDLPSSMFKESKTSKGEVRESGHHSALAGALIAGAPRGVALDLEKASAGGRADIVLRFGDELAWVLEVGIGADSGSKLRQAQVYGEALQEARVMCCSVVVAKQGSASALSVGSLTPITITCTWSQRISLAEGGYAWSSL